MYVLYLGDSVTYLYLYAHMPLDEDENPANCLPNLSGQYYFCTILYNKVWDYGVLYV